jgi:uncharacterized protein YjbI with pentapeptide repeats
MDVRIGGIYALERIATDSVQDRATVAEVLTAFIRGHAPWPPNRPGQYVEHAPIQDIPELRIWAADVQAALMVLGRPKQPTGWLTLLDLHSTDLRGADLAVAQLQEATLTGARLQRAMLGLAQLQGTILTDAQLQRATLYGADLQRVSLVDADLRWANLGEAQLQNADLRRAQLQGATLYRAQLQQAKLGDARLEEADLTEAQLYGARCNANTVWPARFDWEAAGVELREE